MTSDSWVKSIVPDRLVPIALTIRTAFPPGPFPIVRIARYAALALVVLAVGSLASGVVTGVLDVVAVFAPPAAARVWGAGVSLVGDAIEAFTLFVALGVFLTQFESDAE